MKKIYSILIILTVCTIISCGNSSSGDSSHEFIDPKLDEEKAVSPAKAYNIAGQSCGPNKTCNSVIYQGRSQVGIAVANSSGFNLKIYWTDDSIPTSKTLKASPQNYTIKIVNSSKTYDTPDGSMELEIEYVANNVYKITFITGTTIRAADSSFVTIGNNATINAYKYPE